MLLATNVTLLEWVLLATILVCGGGVSWQLFGRKGSDSNSSEDSEQNERAQARAESRVAHLEVRLHDFAREVEARLETRALQLDSLIVAADREIARLSDRLHKANVGQGVRSPDVMHFSASSTGQPADASASPQSSSTVSGAQIEMILNLNDAGYSVTEIAHIIDRPAETVKNYLKAA